MNSNRHKQDYDDARSALSIFGWWYAMARNLAKHPKRGSDSFGAMQHAVSWWSLYIIRRNKARKARSFRKAMDLNA